MRNWTLLFLPPALVFSVGNLLISAFEPSAEYEDLTENTEEITRNGIEYKLRGPHTVYLKEDGTEFSMNFNARAMTIDGADEADSVIQFDDYKNPAFIEDALKSGCVMSGKIREIFQSADNLDILEDEKNRAEDLKDKGEIFYTNYCAQKSGEDMSALSPWMERSFGS